MGTNFYIEESSINARTKERVTEQTHIGKKSFGWTFHFQGENIKTVAEWKAFTETMPANMAIVDEYGAGYTHGEFWQKVEDSTKPWGPSNKEPSTARGRTGNDWHDGRFAFYSGEFC